MGLLDDAIRDHLELKRRHGADPGEVSKLEHEAFGPIQREDALEVGPAPAPPGEDFDLEEQELAEEEVLAYDEAELEALRLSVERFTPEPYVEGFLDELGAWAKGRTPFGPAGEQPVATSGAWVDGTTYAATLAFYQTPFKLNVTLGFAGDTVTYTREMHVGFGDTKLPTLTGRAQ